MRREPRAYLWDVREAADTILEFTRGLQIERYLSNHMLRSAVERQAENIPAHALRQIKEEIENG